ncbi:MAG: serine/threonine-protein phosphatase [Phycisphaeraceae bacterium]|nr:serine/threonine-protein phosphatase [Phycisphaeraceae bacterium]
MEVFGGYDAVETGIAMQGLDAWVYGRPWKGDRAGGDVHYLSSCATGRIARMLIADVSGHGLEAADAAHQLRGLMRRYVNHFDQRRVAGAINRSFVRSSATGTFATAILATFWTPTDEIDLTLAGHPAPLLYRADEARWRIWPDAETASGLPFGIDEDVAYARRRLRLGPRDMLLLCTDGLLEAGANRREMLGVEGVLSILERLNPERPEALLGAMVEGVRMRFGALPDDDLTLLLLRPNAAKPKITLARGVSTGWRIAREVVRSALGRGGPAPLPEVTVRNVAGAFVASPNSTRKSDTGTTGA